MADTPQNINSQLMVFHLLVARAWAEALQKIHYLSVTEFDDYVAALERIGDSYTDDAEPASIGSAKRIRKLLQQKLFEEVGELVDKAMAGLMERERDITVVKLWVMDAVARARTKIDELIIELIKLAERSLGYLICPPNVKLREPVLAAHFILSRIDVELRLSERFQSAIEQIDECPLGSGDGAGCSIAIDREAIATELGFARPSVNALDAVENDEVRIAASLFVLGEGLQWQTLEFIKYLEFENCTQSSQAILDSEYGPAAFAKNPPVYYFQTFDRYINIVSATTSQIARTSVGAHLMTMDSAPAGIRDSILSKRVEGGTAPEVVAKRIAILKSKYRIES